MAIQYERIKKTIAALAAYGTLPQGGTMRLSYTAEYLAAQAFLQREMLESGMLAEVDPIGNLIGTYVGRDPHTSIPYRQAEILTELWVSSQHWNVCAAGRKRAIARNEQYGLLRRSKKSARLLVWLALAYVYAAANLKNSSRSLSCI